MLSPWICAAIAVFIATHVCWRIQLQKYSSSIRTNSLTTKEQTTKTLSSNFQKMLSPNYITLRTQRLEGKQCRSWWDEPPCQDLCCLQSQLFASLCIKKLMNASYWSSCSSKETLFGTTRQPLHGTENGGWRETSRTTSSTDVIIYHFNVASACSGLQWGYN